MDQCIQLVSKQVAIRSIVSSSTSYQKCLWQQNFMGTHFYRANVPISWSILVSKHVSWSVALRVSCNCYMWLGRSDCNLKNLSLGSEPEVHVLQNNAVISFTYFIQYSFTTSFIRTSELLPKIWNSSYVGTYLSPKKNTKVLELHLYYRISFSTTQFSVWVPSMFCISTSVGI